MLGAVRLLEAVSPVPHAGLVDGAAHAGAATRT